jgi:hypothetical protein
VTKAELLRVLDRFPMHANVVFVSTDELRGLEVELTIERAFRCAEGACILTSGNVPDASVEPEEVML